MVNVFLGKGMNIDIRNENGQTALQAASEGGHTDAVKLLLENIAMHVNASPPDDYGRTALQVASEGGHIDIVKLLLENKADIKYNGPRALRAATKTGNLELINILKMQLI